MFLQSPAARPAVAHYVAMGVADLTHGLLLRTAFTSLSALTQATLEFKRMQRKRLNESAISGKRSSRTPRRKRILPPPTTVTSTRQARSAFGSRFSSLSPLLPTPPALAHQSLALLVALLQLLLVPDRVAASPSSSCMMHRFCRLSQTAQPFLSLSKVECRTSRSSSVLSLATPRALAFDVY